VTAKTEKDTVSRGWLQEIALVGRERSATMADVNSVLPRGSPSHPLPGGPHNFAGSWSNWIPVTCSEHRKLSPRVEAELKTSSAEVMKMKCTGCGQSATDLFGGFCGRCESILDDEFDVVP
jgi:hypothetical protein